jgi:Fic family protein
MSYSEDFIDDIMERFTFDRYLNKAEIFFRLETSYLRSQGDIWSDIVTRRKQSGRKLTLKDQNGNHFWYMIPPFLEKQIHEIDFVARKRLNDLILNETMSELVAESILDEAYFSSVIEGAFSTKKRTRELVNQKNPKNKSEHMILNNYNVLLFILDNLDKELNEEVFLSLHKIITMDTLDSGDISEKYRDDFVYVWAEDATKDTPIYTAPKAEDVQWMMADLFAFINSEKQSEFIDPLIKSFIIHFYIVYVHPFFDGNGRVARAFSYMYLLKNGYDFFKFFSVSSIVNQSKAKYYKSIKEVEDFENDVIYFIKVYSELTLKSISETINKLVKNLDSEVLVKQLEKDEILLSERQKKFLKTISKKDSNLITIEEYKKLAKVAYETARRDLTELESLGVFKKVKKGKKFIYKYLGIKGYEEL